MESSCVYFVISTALLILLICDKTVSLYVVFDVNLWTGDKPQTTPEGTSWEHVELMIFDSWVLYGSM